jgi:hypothetical protein
MMPFVLADRIKEYTTSTGTYTTSVVLAGTALGYRTFASVLADGDICYYCMDDLAGNWEIGLGTFSSATPSFTRATTPISSSNANASVTFGVGTKEIYITVPSTGFAYQDYSNGKAYRVGYTNGIIDSIEVSTS